MNATRSSRWLDEDFEIAVLHQVAGDDTAEDDNDADDYKHGVAIL